MTKAGGGILQLKVVRILREILKSQLG